MHSYTGALPRMGMRGAMIFASSQRFLNTPFAMIINALVSFVVISLPDMFLMLIITLSVVGLVFIPIVVNVDASGGDFMAAYWSLCLPRRA